MNETGLIVAIFISAVFIVNALISCLSPAGDFNTTNFEGTGFDIDDLFSFKGFLHFMFGFSWSWAVWGLSTIEKTLLAIGVGLVCVILLSLVYRFLFKLEANEHVKEPIENLKGRQGTIYSIIDDKNDIKTYYGNILYDGEYNMFMISSKEKFNIGEQFTVINVVNNYIEISKIN